jgi:hypothetical protein
MKGLIVSVYRRPGIDCTLNGLTAHEDTLILVGLMVEGPFGPPRGKDYLVLTRDAQGNPRATPKSLLDAKSWVMFGGNFVYSSDARFHQLNGGNPIKVYDRVEPRVE